MDIGIVVIAFKRHDLLKNTLRKLFLSNENVGLDIAIYIDGARNKEEEIAVSKVRSICSLFPLTYINNRDKNLGLEKNITSAITEMLTKYEAVIVIEEDISVHPSFVDYMCFCLSKFKNNNNIYHINGFVPISMTHDYFYQNSIMSCWGWGTWRNRWKEYERDLELVEKMSLFQRIRFNNYFSMTFFSHLIGNKLGIKETWAIFWYLAIFNANGKCINPPKCLVENTGLASGENPEFVSYKISIISEKNNFSDFSVDRSYLSWLFHIKFWWFYIKNTKKKSLLSGLYKIFC